MTLINTIKTKDFLNNLSNSINKNKYALFLIIFLFVIYYIYYNNDVVEHCIYLSNNETLKLIIFALITYITSYDIVIGICLAIFALVGFQLITYVKYKKELDDTIEKIESEL